MLNPLDDEDSDEEIQDENVEGDKMNEEETNEEAKVDALYRDVNVNLEERDTKMTDAPRTIVQITQVIKDTHVIITLVNPEGQQQSSSVSSGFVSNMLNPSLDTCIDSLFNLNTESTSLVDVSVTTFAACHLAVSSIPSIVDAYLASKMHEAVKQLFIKEQVKAQVSKILLKIEKTVNEQLEAEVLTRSSNESKTSHAIAANLSELELKKILIDKMESNKSIHRSDEQKNLYKAMMRIKNPPLDQTGGPREEELEMNQSLPVHQRKRPPRQLASLLKGLNLITNFQHPDWFQKPAKPPTPDRDWNKTLPDAHGPVQPWLSSLAQMEDPRESFNELMDTPLDFSTFVMNRLKVLVELDYSVDGKSSPTRPTMIIRLEQPLKVLQYPHDLRKPLPLIPNSRGRQVIPFDHFINNDLEYLSGGVSSRKYTTSVTKTKAADYGHIKWIEDLGILHWGRKRQQFYGFAANRESARDVYSKRRIIAVTNLQIVEWHNYKHLDWITVRRDDDKLYKFKEGDFNRLRIQDKEDMLLLLVQGKLTNLTVEERLAFNVSLRMFTRSVVI
ncbi:hypothetical protein Tco_1345574 [Tanacetum coccineum]